jgi:hypothetical protein
LFHRVTAVMAKGKHPVTFRTRKLSSSAPMVLHRGRCGRVGHRRTIFHEGPPPSGGGPSCFPGPFPGLSQVFVASLFRGLSRSFPHPLPIPFPGCFPGVSGFLGASRATEVSSGRLGFPRPLGSRFRRFRSVGAARCSGLLEGRASAAGGGHFLRYGGVR